MANSYLNRDELRNAPGSGNDVMRALSGSPVPGLDGRVRELSRCAATARRTTSYSSTASRSGRLVHFEQTLGEEATTSNDGGRYSISRPTPSRVPSSRLGMERGIPVGRKVSLLQFDVVDGAPSPVGSMRVDLAGLEFLYEGPSGFHDDTTMFVQARRLRLRPAVRHHRRGRYRNADHDRRDRQDPHPVR